MKIHPHLKQLLEARTPIGARQLFETYVNNMYDVQSYPMYDMYTPRCNPMPCMLVAHADTISRPKGVRLMELYPGVITNVNGVLGADDRAGMFVIEQIVRNYYRNKMPLPYILVTDGEESGGIGARACAETVMPDVHMLVEYDRRGSSEYVHYSYDELPDDVEDILEAFGYSSGNGTYSDVSTLSTKWDVAHVNLSCGYRNEHTSAETLSLAALDFAIKSGHDMLPLLCEEHRYFVPRKKYTYHSKWGNIYDNGDYDWDDDKVGTTVRHACDICLVESDRNITCDGMTFCEDCAELYVKSCDVCGTNMIYMEGTRNECPYCETSDYTAQGEL